MAAGVPVGASMGSIMGTRIVNELGKETTVNDTATIPSPTIALVTDRNLVGGIDALVAAVADAVDGGVNLVQMREKDLPDAEQLELAKRLREAIAGRALLFVNDSMSVAEAVGADGVHLGEKSRTVASVRSASNGRLLIGRSVHDVGGAREAATQGADLLTVGAVYESPSNPDQVPEGTGLIADVSLVCDVPVLGIGGITPANAARVLEAGASGVAVISAVLDSAEPGDAAERLSEAVLGAWQTLGRV